MSISRSLGITNANAVSAAQQANRTRQPANVTNESNSINTSDVLDLSSEAVNGSTVTGANESSGDIRTERVAEIRRQIADGTYDTEERLSAALDSFLDRLG